MEWISVNDRLPEQGWLWCYAPTRWNHLAYVVAYYYPGEEWIESCHHMPVKVTHWMPLPEPPKTEG